MGEESEDNRLPSDEEAVISDEAGSIPMHRGMCGDARGRCAKFSRLPAAGGTLLASGSAILSFPHQYQPEHRARQLQLSQIEVPPPALHRQRPATENAAWCLSLAWL